MNYYEIMNKIVAFKNSVLNITPEAGLEDIAGGFVTLQREKKLEWLVKNYYIGQKIKISFCNCGCFYLGNRLCKCGKFEVIAHIELDAFDKNYVPTQFHLAWFHYKNNPPSYWNKKIYGRG